ncbi:FadR family transcriptional regulator [Alicyclobacillus fastidiosus]|uniref:FadR family transcriptional regulator n=1 Tax=Alicyclobacillus fastidiosus TaxID=392011 RepID=A0ABY6ZJ63_9BACL|nr:FadR/GntR family transcriptional regulator [Alicyclobacillus fastidiosus]WAH42932.1 FadR family transcriptional regulator [Alicyclobacillus fastidiosus]GMA64884.1 transcriptional regulator NanR [Alicyclobacillus fastidiosus]
MQPLRSNVKLSEQVQKVLIDKIENGQYAVNEFLPSEAELCDSFGVSRATIREALRGLESRGFVELQHGKGVRVTNKSVQVVMESLRSMIVRCDISMDELLQVRRIVELETVRLAAENATDRELMALEDTLRVMYDSISSDENYIQNDFLFHVLIAKTSGNRILESILLALEPLLKGCIQTTLHVDIRPEVSMNYHQKIFDCVRSKDVAGAVQNMKEHLNATEKMLSVNGATLHNSFNT